MGRRAKRTDIVLVSNQKEQNIRRNLPAQDNVQLSTTNTDSAAANVQKLKSPVRASPRRRKQANGMNPVQPPVTGPEEVVASPARKRKRERIEIKNFKLKSEALPDSEPGHSGKAKIKSKSKASELGRQDQNVATEERTNPPALKRKRKTKEEKEADEMPLAARTSGLKMYIGAHVSCAKGVHNSVINSLHVGGNAFAMFLKSQRKWDNPPLQDDHRDQFKARCAEHDYNAAQHVLPHGSYLVNLAQADPVKAAQAYSGFIDDLRRCDELGIKYYNFHPGTTGGFPRPAAISRIAAALNRAHGSTHGVVPVLETMATIGSNVIGSTFEDIRDIISQVQNKDRIGVCIDTCHIFAAGYDLRNPKAFKMTLQRFDDIIGMKFLKALHLNDSKAPLGAGRDLHQNIGLGFLGLRAFHNVVNEERFEGLPLVLETPIDRKDENGKEIEDKQVWVQEIKLLESLIGIDAESKAFKDLERDLSNKGAEERQKHQEAFERKKEKLEKGQTKLKFGNGKKRPSETESEIKV